MRNKLGSKIKVSISQDFNAFVWNAGDVLRLRQEFHITGGLVGTLPMYPLQNRYFGLPLQLSAEEVTWLLELGVIYLIAPHKCQLEFINDFSLVYETLSHKCDSSIKDLTALRKALDLVKILYIPMDRSVCISYRPGIAQAVTLQQAKQRGVWNFPDTAEERFRYEKWKETKRESGFLSNGFKFGGLWLTYRSDPFLVHSDSIVSLSNSNKEMTLLSQVAAFRLANQVNKEHRTGSGSVISWSNII